MLKRIKNLLFNRLTFMIIVIIVEVFIILGLSIWLGQNAAWLEQLLRILSVVFVLFIIKNSRHLSADMMWILLVLIAPIPGTALYLFLRADMLLSKTFRSIVKSTADSMHYFDHDRELLKEMSEKAPELRGQFHYIDQHAGYPFYRNEEFKYYPLVDDGYPVMLEELKKAKEFIFLEYFIIEEGKMWDGILDILEQKVKEGVEVRVMYDDLGSFFTLDIRYAKKLEEKGIKCVSFNRINPILGIIMNHRDHRKILVIDGKVAFSGGTNLADEYINVKKIHGHWKDNVLCVKGPAVWSFTILFLTHWNALRPEDKDYEVYRRDNPEPKQYDGYIAPYGETPFTLEITAQNIYINMLNQAQKYCYIMTPYLIIDTELINALILAAKRGVDVRILTPGVPDKKIVWDVTRSYYRQLILGEVRIFEYTPGFVHSKVFVCDDKVATVGTINLDYRSLYLHFENGTYLFDSKVIPEIREDALNAFSVSREIILADTMTGLIKELYQSALRLIAPLM